MVRMDTRETYASRVGCHDIYTNGDHGNGISARDDADLYGTVR